MTTFSLSLPGMNRRTKGGPPARPQDNAAADAVAQGIPAKAVAAVERGRDSRSDELVSTIVAVSTSDPFDVQSVDVDVIPKKMLRMDSFRAFGLRLIQGTAAGAATATLTAGATAAGDVVGIGFHVWTSIPLTEGLPPAITYTTSYTDEARLARTFTPIIAPGGHRVEFLMFPGVFINNEKAHANPVLLGHDSTPQNATVAVAGVTSGTATRVTLLCQGNNYWRNYVVGRF